MIFDVHLTQSVGKYKKLTVRNIKNSETVRAFGSVTDR